MPLSSMTGFAKSTGSLEGLNWQWEIKSVNGKALDVRCRLPLGFEALEQGVRTAATERIKRGSLQISLNVNAASHSETVRLNEAVLEQVLSAARLLQERVGGEPVRADVILSGRRARITQSFKKGCESSFLQSDGSLEFSGERSLYQSLNLAGCSFSIESGSLRNSSISDKRCTANQAEFGNHSFSWFSISVFGAAVNRKLSI